MTLPANSVDVLVRIETVEIVETPPAEAELVLRAYYTDIIDRYHGRPARADEVDDAMAAEPNDHLLLLLAKDGEGVLGCSALDLTKPPFVEVKRVWVVPEARGRGVARAMLAAVEEIALNRGAVTMRLNVRHDLVEARALYTKVGYTEIEAFNDDPYADFWLGKDLLHFATVEATDSRLGGLIAALDSELWDRYGDEDIGPSPIKPDARFVLACRGTVPVGCVSIQPRGEDMELKRMYVAPEARGTGVAPLLVDAALELAAEMGGSRVVLETGVRQPEAIRLYEKCGFTRIPNYQPYDQDPLSICYSAIVA